MYCPSCGGDQFRVSDSRGSGDAIRRRRSCQVCGTRFTTYERINRNQLIIVKRDGRREDFQREKLVRSIRLACVKRPLPTGSLDKLVDDIEDSLQRMDRAEVPHTTVGELAIAKLKALDWVSYLRYISVFQDFDDLDKFQIAIEELKSALEDTLEESEQTQLLLIPENANGLKKIGSRRGRRPNMTQPQPHPGLGKGNRATNRTA